MKFFSVTTNTGLLLNKSKLLVTFPELLAVQFSFFFFLNAINQEGSTIKSKKLVLCSNEDLGLAKALYELVPPLQLLLGGSSGMLREEVSLGNA